MYDIEHHRIWREARQEKRTGANDHVWRYGEPLSEFNKPTDGVIDLTELGRKLDNKFLNATQGECL